MVWLATHIWMLLAAAALIGLLLGLGLRGLLLGGKTRRALVERDVALTELEQARTEIEGLYASQRRAQQAAPAEQAMPDSDTAHLRDELAAREAKVASLTEELFRSREEIEALKSEQDSPASGAGLAAAGAVAGAAAASLAGSDAPSEAEAEAGSDEASLEWRNSYLESRVRRLEQDLAEATSSQTVADTPRETPDETAAVAGIDQTDVAKLRWQNDYLQTRVKVLEEKLTAALAVAGGPELDEPAVAADDEVAAPATAETARAETADEELARLRWRNRYLEGRLAYLEEGGADAGQPATVPRVAAGLAAGAAAVGAIATEASDAPEADPEETPESVTEPASETPVEAEAALESATDTAAGTPDMEVEAGLAATDDTAELVEAAAPVDDTPSDPDVPTEDIAETGDVGVVEPLVLADEAADVEDGGESVPVSSPDAVEPEMLAEAEMPEAGAPDTDPAEPDIAEPELEEPRLAEPAMPEPEASEPDAQPLLGWEPWPVFEPRSDASGKDEGPAEPEPFPVDPVNPPPLFGGWAGMDGAPGTEASEAYVPAFASEPADREPALEQRDPEPELAPEPEPEPEPVQQEPELVEKEMAAEEAVADPDPSVNEEARSSEPVEPAPEPESAGDTIATEAVEVDPAPAEAAAGAEALEAPEIDTAAGPDVTPERPPSVSRPRDGGDDLSEIGGIGPRIRDVLQELGIYRFSQVAAWTPANEAWIDDYLSFSGRVGRERWVEQAQALVEQAGPDGDAGDGQDDAG